MTCVAILEEAGVMKEFIISMNVKDKTLHKL